MDFFGLFLLVASSVYVLIPFTASGMMLEPSRFFPTTRSKLVVSYDKILDPIERDPDGTLSERLGVVTLAPDQSIPAGQVGQWTLRYRMGCYGVDEGGTIKIAQRFASDWESPQFDHPEEPRYSTVTTSGAARLRARFDPKGFDRPYTRCIVIDVYDGYLSPGDEVTVTLGDLAAGSPGIRAQTFLDSAHEFVFLVDPTNANRPRRLPSSPAVPIVAGEPVRLVTILPTRGRTGQAQPVFVKGEDRWGNPTPPPGEVAKDKVSG